MTQRMVFLLNWMVTKNCVAQTKNVTKMGLIIKGAYYSWGFYAKNSKPTHYLSGFPLFEGGGASIRVKIRVCMHRI